MGHYNSVHKFIPVPQAAKIPDAKAAVVKVWNKLETISAWQLNKGQEQQGGHPRGTKKTKGKSTWLLSWTYVISRIRSWNQKFRSAKVESCSEETL